MSLFHLYAAVAIVPAQVLRPVHVGWTLLLVFLLFPIAARYRNRLMWWDVVCAALGVATIVYLLAGGDDFWDRNTLPNHADVFFGVTFVLLVLEAVRRTSGWILLFVICLFLAVRIRRPVASGPMGAPRLRRRRACRASCTRRSKASSAPRSTCRRRSSSCSRSTAHSCSTPVPASSISTGASPRWAASTAGPAARSCWRRSCWAGLRARASRRR